MLQQQQEGEREELSFLHLGQQDPAMGAVSTLSEEQDRADHAAAATVQVPESRHSPRGRDQIPLTRALILLSAVALLATMTGMVAFAQVGPLVVTRTVAPTAVVKAVLPTRTVMATASRRPAFVVEDTFTRIDQPLWGTATDGHLWGGDANTRPVFSIVNGRGQIAGAQGTLNAVVGPPLTDVDVLLTGQINHFVTGTVVNLGVVVRWSDPDHWYKLLIDGTHLFLLKRAGAGPGNRILAVQAFAAQTGRLYHLRFQARGTLLRGRAWPDGTVEPTTWMLSATDATLVRGQVGVRVLMQAETVMQMTGLQARAL